jgi:replication factor A1
LRRKTSTGEYLAFISVKYEVDPDKLFQALITAEENRKASSGDLRIECRGKTENSAMFLILKDSKVVAQFSVLNEFLLQQDNPIGSYMNTDMIRRLRTKRKHRSLILSIKDLRIGMRQISLKAKVMEIPKSKLVFTRYGDYANVANALIADETGTIRLCLWNEQISSVSTGDTIRIDNARTSMFRGQKQLYIGKNGSLSNIAEQTVPNERRLLSVVPV